MIRSTLPPWSIALLTMLSSARAHACPSCPTSERVRCVVLGDGFWQNVGIAVLPFLVVGVISALVYRVGAHRVGAHRVGAHELGANPPRGPQQRPQPPVPTPEGGPHHARS